MELVGGVMIMLGILGLLLASVWLSLPLLFIGLWRRLERLELRITAFEHRLDRIQESIQPAPAAASTTVATEPEQGGVDGTA